MGIGWIATERILPDQPRRDLDVDMGAGLKRRQPAVVRIDQIENDDAQRLLLPTRDHEIERGGTLGGDAGRRRRDRLRECS